MADGSVIIDTELDQSGLKTGLAGLGTTLTKGITTAVAAAGAALVGLGGYAINVGSDFEYAISGVAATMGKTKEEITVLADRAKELGASTQFTASEAAEGFNILAQAGLSLDEQLQAIDSTLSLASAGEMSMDAAAGYLTTTIKAMSASTREAGLSFDDTAKIADMFAKGAVLAKTTTSDFGDAMSKTAAMAGSYNQSLTTTGSALLALADGGYTGSAAGTYLSRALSDLYAPSANAEKALSALGVSAYDEAGKSRDLIDVIDDLESAMAGMTEEEKNATTATIFTSAGLKAYNTIVSQGTDKLKGFSTELENSTGAAQEMSETKLDNLQGEITILKSATEGFGIALYEALSGIGEDTGMMRDFVHEASAIMSELTAAVNKNGFDGLVNALGGALAKAVNKIVEYVPMLVQGGVQIVSSLVQGLASSAGQIAQSATGLISVLVEGFLSITTDLVELGGELIIALCEGLAANAGNIVNTITTGLVDLVNKVVEFFPRLVEAGVSLLNALVQGILEALPTLVEAIPQLIEAVIGALMQALPMLIECIAELLKSIVGALPGLITTLIESLPDLIQMLVDALIELIPQLIEAVIQTIIAIAEALPEIIQSIIEILPSLIESIVGGILELIPMLLECSLQVILAIVQALPELIQSIVDCIPSLISTIINGIITCIPQLLLCVLDIILAIVAHLPEIILNIITILPTLMSSIIQAIIECIPMFIECAMNLIIAITQALPDIIIRIVEILPTLIASIVSGLIDCLPQLIKCVVQMVVAIAKALPKIFLTIVEKLIELVKNLAENIKNLWTKFKEAAKEWISKIWEGIKDKWSTLIANIQSFFKQIPEKIKAAIGNIAEVGKNLVLGIWNGINNATQWVLDKIKGFGQSILNGIKKFFGIASPSKVFRDIVGKNLALGLAEGIEENEKVAIDAARSMADGINDVDFVFGDAVVPDYDGYVAKMQGVVDHEAADIGTAISASRASESYTRSKEVDSPETDEDGDSNPQYIENNIYVDGKKTARVITPYVAKELAWEDK